MTLKEKITDEYIWTTEPIMDAEEVSESVDKMIVIVDEFAINFANWYSFMIKQTDNLNERFTPKELIEIFKKEKGL
jgi:hypothetical protein